MTQNRMRQRLAQGQTLLGVNNMYPTAGIIEGMCKGYDFVWIDGQHGQMDYTALLHAVRAAGAMNIDTLIRVPGHEYGILGPVADLDPAAVMVPMVDTPEQARKIVQALRFPPVGNRSYGGRRVIDLHGREYYQQHADFLVVAQVETLEAARNAPAIIGVEGIDVLFFGPDDMKVRMGLPINTAPNEHPQLRQAMLDTARAARDAGKWAGTVAVTPAAVKLARELGYQLLIAGGDNVFLRTAAAARLAELRPVIDGAAPPPPAAKPVANLYGG